MVTMINYECPFCGQSLSVGQLEDTEYSQTRRRTKQYFHRSCYLKNLMSERKGDKMNMKHIEDELNSIVLCKHCGRPEYYGEMRWLSGFCGCRNCYRARWESENHQLYTWDDLDGPRPTMGDYKNQREEMKNS